MGVQEQENIQEDVVFYDPTTPENQRKFVQFWLSVNRVSLSWAEELVKNPWKASDSSVENPADRIPRIKRQIEKLENIQSRLT